MKNQKNRTKKVLEMKATKEKVRDGKKKQEKMGFAANKSELQEIIRHLNIINIRLDSALMGLAALILHQVDTKQITWKEYKKNETGMSESLKLIRQLQQLAVATLGQSALPDDIRDFIYEKAAEKGMDNEVLENIFGVKKSESKIIKPRAGIVVPK